MDTLGWKGGTPVQRLLCNVQLGKSLPIEHLYNPLKQVAGRVGLNLQRVLAEFWDLLAMVPIAARCRRFPLESPECPL